MNRPPPPIIDMLPDGTFQEHVSPGMPPPGMMPPGMPPKVPFSAKLMLGGILVAAVAASITVAALAIWVVSLVLPFAILGGAVAWAALKFRQWQLFRGDRRGPPDFSRQPGGFGQ